MSSAAQPFTAQLLTEVTADETTSVAVEVGGLSALTFYVIGSGTTSSGVITIEEAWYDPSLFGGTGGYGGTWSSMTTINASDVTGGAQKAYHPSFGAYKWVRARISTAIGGGGNISVVLIGTSN